MEVTISAVENGYLVVTRLEISSADYVDYEVKEYVAESFLDAMEIVSEFLEG